MRRTKGDTRHAEAAWRTGVTSSDGLTSCPLAEVHRSGAWISYLPKPGNPVGMQRQSDCLASSRNHPLDWCSNPPRCHTQAPSRASGLRQQRRAGRRYGRRRLARRRSQRPWRPRWPRHRPGLRGTEQCTDRDKRCEPYELQRLRIELSGVDSGSAETVFGKPRVVNGRMTQPAGVVHGQASFPCQPRPTRSPGR